MARPNILLIVIDAARADRFSCYGYHRKTTPNIDRLAEQGTVYLNHYAAANVTFPSHVSIFTGVHPYFHGAAENRSHYDGRYPTLQEILSEHGYQTVGLSYNAQLSPLKGIASGFQRYHEVYKKKGLRKIIKTKERSYLRSLARQIERYLGKQTLLSPMKKTFKGLRHPIRAWLKYHKYRKQLEKHSKDKGGKTVISLIKEEIKRCKSEKSKFYIFANLLEPHWPYLPPKGYRDFLLQDKTISYNLLRFLFEKEHFKELAVELLPEDWAIINNLYDAGLVYTDALLGDLLSFLEGGGIMDDTIIVITSDHGELLGEHGLVVHGKGLYEPLIKTPLIIRYPGKFKRGHRESIITQSIDIFPTILNLINAEEKKSLFNYKGIYLCNDALKGVNDRFIVIDNIGGWGAQIRPELPTDERKIERAIVTEEYKYVWSNSGVHRLHNIKEDPHEEKNLYSEAYRPIIEALHTNMINWYLDQLRPQQDFDLHRYDYNKVKPGELSSGPRKNEVQEIEKMLEDLGYID